MHETAIKMAGINERDRSLLRLLAKKRLGPEINHPSGRYRHTQVPQGCRKLAHGRARAGLNVILDQMNELARVIRRHDISVWNPALFDMSICFPTAARYDDLLWFCPALDRVRNDILLQNIVFTESCGAGFEYVQS